MDCLEGMKEIPDKYFDLVLTDPPYGIGESMSNHASRGKYPFGGKSNSNRNQLATASSYGYSEWDKERIDKKIFDEMFRISKNQIIFGGNYYTDYLAPSSCWIVWDKRNGNNDFADCELAWGSFNKAVRIFRYRWHGMLQEDMKNKEVRYHPTQKPVALFKWILEKYSNDSDIIIDPFAGSGTLGVACKKLKRKFIGFDINQKYVDIANKRISEVVSHDKTFEDAYDKLW